MVKKRITICLVYVVVSFALCGVGRAEKPEFQTAVSTGEWSNGNDPAGVYTLFTVDGSELPATVSHGDAKIMLHSGTFIINADKTCVSKTVFGSPSGDKVTRQVKGAYTQNGSTLNVKWQGAGVTQVTIKGDTLIMSNEGMMFIYKKGTVISKRYINGDFEGGTYVHSSGAKMPLMWDGVGGALHYENDGSNGYIVLSNSDSDWSVAHPQKPAISLSNFGVTAGETVAFNADIIKLAGDGSVHLKLEEYKDGGATANGVAEHLISPTNSWSTYWANFTIKPDTDSVILVLVADNKGASYGFDNVTFAPIDAPVSQENRKETEPPEQSEFAAMDKRLQTMKKAGTSARMMVYPARVAGDHTDQTSATHLAELLNEAGLCQATVAKTGPVLKGEGWPDESAVLWLFARAARSYVRQHPTDSDYVLFADYWDSPRKTTWAVHFVVCDRAGDWVIVDLQNSHHPDFQRINPKTLADGDRLMLERLKTHLR